MWGSYCNVVMTWASKGKKAVEKESTEAALVMKVMSLLSKPFKTSNFIRSSRNEAVLFQG